MYTGNQGIWLPLPFVLRHLLSAMFVQLYLLMQQQINVRHYETGASFNLFSTTSYMCINKEGEASDGSGKETAFVHVIVQCNIQK